MALELDQNRVKQAKYAGQRSFHLRLHIWAHKDTPHGVLYLRSQCHCLNIHLFMALKGTYCADVPLRNYSLSLSVSASIRHAYWHIFVPKKHWAERSKWSDPPNWNLLFYNWTFIAILLFLFPASCSCSASAIFRRPAAVCCKNTNWTCTAGILSRSSTHLELTTTWH